ncbi:MAG: hypothetical protein AAFQ50_17580, partial [Pseudomonadota bacterium]
QHQGVRRQFHGIVRLQGGGVDAAGALGVVTRFMVSEYKDSLLYRGRDPGAETEAEDASPVSDAAE